MADSPLKAAVDRASYKITCAGAAVDDSVQVISLRVLSSVNKISIAELEIFDGDIATQEFPVANGSNFKPGTEIKIEAGYGSTTEEVFSGIVTRMGVEMDTARGSRLLVECRDKSVKMTIGRKNANYVDKTDSDILSTVIGSYGLTADVSSTSLQHKELVQYYSTDWDFLVARTEVNGMIVLSSGETVTVTTPQTSASPVLTVEYGGDLIEFKADTDNRDQISQVKAVSWSPSTQAIVSQTASPKSLNEQGNIDSATLAEATSPSSYRLQTPVPLEQEEIKSWAESQQLKSGLSRIRGRMKFQGSAKAVPGSLIEVKGVGDRFSGNVFVSSVQHELAEGEWLTEVDFGQSAEWFADRRDLVTPPASGLLPGIEGLHLGVVKKLDADPAGEKRIQVSIPLLEAETDGVWARLTNFYASKEFGEFFIPEIGDEVLLGYLNNDPSYPVILGSLYSSNRTPPYDLTAENNTKAIVTRSKLRFIFDDDKKVITLITPANNQIVISDDDKSITLKDEHGNKAILNADGITLDSYKDVVVKAQGKITMTAMDSISATAQADVKITGLNVTETAQVAYTAKGNASAELSASGQTTVRGAMVMIN
jgi:Rhs element Vgr protein